MSEQERYAETISSVTWWLRKRKLSPEEALVRESKGQKINPLSTLEIRAKLTYQKPNIQALLILLI